MFISWIGVTDKITKQFVDTGKVSQSVLVYISKKVMRNETLTQNELTIFYGKTSEINQIITKTK